MEIGIGTVVTVIIGGVAAMGAAIVRDRHVFNTINKAKDDTMDEIGKVYDKLDDNKDKFTEQVAKINEKINTTLVQKPDFLESNRLMRESISTLTDSHTADRNNTQLMLNTILAEVKK